MNLIEEINKILEEHERNEVVEGEVEIIKEVEGYKLFLVRTNFEGYFGVVDSEGWVHFAGSENEGLDHGYQNEFNVDQYGKVGK
ncbi:MAG: hypothetical protein K0R18_104 [Bacillales bacterium]|jgi:hypothetical protein|nr:hypothetical protein [Bacillales bacterium]